VPLQAAPGFLGFLGNLVNMLVFILKCWVLVFVMMWLRWTLPRLRIDQVMMTCLKYLLPISCFLLLGVSLWMVSIPGFVAHNLKYLLAAASIAAFVAFLVKATTTTTPLPFENVGDRMSAGQAPRYGALTR
jgi:NADH-quinone oxidoreductase subunit H